MSLFCARLLASPAVIGIRPTLPVPSTGSANPGGVTATLPAPPIRSAKSQIHSSAVTTSGLSVVTVRLSAETKLAPWANPIV